VAAGKPRNLASEQRGRLGLGGLSKGSGVEQLVLHKTGVSISAKGKKGMG